MLELHHFSHPLLSEQHIIRLQEVGRVDVWVVKVEPDICLARDSRPWLGPCRTWLGLKGVLSSGQRHIMSSIHTIMFNPPPD